VFDIKQKRGEKMILENELERKMYTFIFVVYILLLSILATFSLIIFVAMFSDWTITLTFNDYHEGLPEFILINVLTVLYFLAFVFLAKL
jgi:hypothetical protein